MNAFVQSLQQSWQETTAPLRQRWLLLASREQQALRILAIFFAVFILVYGIWLPSRHAASTARSQYESNRELLLQMQAGTGQARSGTMAATGSILGLVSDAAAAGNLALSRIEPEGDDQARVWVERADFNVVAAWLAKLSGQGVTVREIQAEKQSDGNGVSARFVFSR